MQRLNRESVPKPTCLEKDNAGRRYSDLRKEEKSEIRTRLLEMQHQRCAYCERRTGTQNTDGHIEHFRKQADHPEHELDWSNLFWSCVDESTCGKHKDKCDRPIGTGPQATFVFEDIINPCEDDPSDFLLFVSDGTVRPREELPAAIGKKARETLRVFQLADSAFLQRCRHDAVRPYFGIISTLLKTSPELLVEYARNELEKIERAPFATAVCHYFRGLFN